MSSQEPWDEQAAGNPDSATPVASLATHTQAVFAVCLANTQNYHDAEDVMQSVFLKASGKISSLRDPARVRGWLLQVARRACIDLHRRRKPAEPLVDEPPTAPPRDNALCERLHEAIRDLPANYREVIALYYMDGRDCASVATSLGITEQAVRQRLVRARAMLHNSLQGDRL